MDRRPDSQENGRFKRRKTADMDSRSDPLLADMKEASPVLSDDDGGVKLEGYYSKPATPKQEKKDVDVKLKPLQSHDDSGSSSIKRKRKEEDHDSGSSSIKRKRKEEDHDSESSSIKRKRKEEDHDSKPNSYLAQQYEKPTKKESDPKSNPYLAHMYEDEEVEDKAYDGYSNSYGKAMNRTTGVSDASTLARFPRHKTTAAMAKKAEDGPNNPFSGKLLSSQYFNILRTRRSLPVHQQR